jgi:hypothetical protein
MQALKLGYRVMYLDTDALVLKNPLPYFSEQYDMQGLSDYLTAGLPPTGRMADYICTVMRDGKGVRVCAGGGGGGAGGCWGLA